MSHFFNQRWLVVGCSRRLGLFVSQKLLLEGAEVIGLYRSPSSALSKLKEEFSDQLLLHEFDLSSAYQSPNTLRTFFEETFESSRINGVIHLSSQFFPAPLDSLSPADWETLFDTNVKGHVFLTQLFTPFLQTQSSITHLLDIYATKPLPQFLAYAAAKGALLTVIKNLAVDLAPSTRVNAISPGSVLLPENYSKEEYERHAQNNLLQRLGEPEDIWNAFRFLSTNEYLTGVNLKVDGGTSLL